MQKMKQIGVGILGFGTVGAGVADGLLKHRDVMAKRLGVDIVLRKIADLDITTDRGIQVPEGVLTTDAKGVLSDPEIDIVVETIGGTGVAKTFVLEALNGGKCVVTANKKLLAEHGREIFETAAKNDVDIYFGASVGGGIPIIRVLREGLAGNEIESIHGILNGTCNYILTRMENEGLPFESVLKDAQKLGYAEANPSLDIDGFDTAHKACILAALAYGFQPGVDQVQVEGIRNLDGADVKYAADFGYLGADVADAHDTECKGVKLQAVTLCEHGQHRRDILLDGPGIAPGSIAPSNPVGFTPRRIYMVETYRGRGYRPDGRPDQEGCIATGTRARDYRVGILHHLRRRLGTRQVYDFRVRL